MRVALVENVSPRNIVNKDQMGGYGIGSRYGDAPLTRLVSSLKRGGRRIPLLTHGYLAAILKANGHEVLVHNGDAAGGALPDAELFVVHSSIVESRHEAEFARRVKRETKAKVGFVGPFSAIRPDLYQDAGDFVVQGEPEELFKRLRGPGDIPAGVTHSPEVSDLNALPFPDWSPFNPSLYGYWPVLLEAPFFPILSSRGCSFRCNYCPYIVQYPEWRMRTPENTVEELKSLVERHGARSVLFRDPLFTQGKGRAEAIAKGIMDAGLHERLRWACETRTDLLSEPLIDLLYAAGMRGLNVGVESADLDVLHSANRNQAAAHRERIVGYAEAKGVKVAAFYVLGLPGDTEQTIRDTIAYSQHLNTFAAQFHVNTPFPGTPVYEMYKDSIFETDLEKFNSFTPVFRHPKLSPERLTALKDSAYGGYYFRPGYLRKHWRALAGLVG